jgi:hypothetical protein
LLNERKVNIEKTMVEYLMKYLGDDQTVSIQEFRYFALLLIIISKFIKNIKILSEREQEIIIDEIKFIHISNMDLTFKQIGNLVHDLIGDYPL